MLTELTMQCVEPYYNESISKRNESDFNEHPRNCYRADNGTYMLTSSPQSRVRV